MTTKKTNPDCSCSKCNAETCACKAQATGGCRCAPSCACDAPCACNGCGCCSSK